MIKLQTRRVHEMLAAYTFLLPAFLFLMIFVAIPAVWALILSFCRWDMISPPRFAGLAHWIKVFSSDETKTSIFTTLLIVLLSSPVSIAIGLILALLLDRLPFGKTLYRTIFFVPFVATLTAVSFVWSDLFDTQNGIFNYLLSLIGLDPVPWLIYPGPARLAVSIVLIWQNVGFNMLVFLAGLQGLDQTYYEAAIVDGAKARHVLLYITVPLLSPITFFLTINMIIRGFQLYESVYVLTAGGPGYSTSTLVYFIYKTAFSTFNVGLASAMSMVLFILIGIFTLIMWSVQSRWVHYGD
jgi:multiple sugar transport system permease protein